MRIICRLFPDPPERTAGPTAVMRQDGYSRLPGEETAPVSSACPKSVMSVISRVRSSSFGRR